MKSDVDTQQRRAGILAQLDYMYRRRKPLSDVQKDLLALNSFCGFHHEGLENYFFASGYIFPLLRDAMARQGFARTATVLDKVGLLFPDISADASDDELKLRDMHVERTYGDRIKEFGKEIEQFKEDYEAAVEAIFRDRMDELPEPLELLPGKWVPNPFKPGEKMYIHPRYPR